MDSSPGHMREYLTQVLTTWVEACCAPPPPQDDAAARAGECSADTSSSSLLTCASWQQVAGRRAGAGGLPQVVSPGEVLLRLEGYLALERGAPPVPDAAHIHHKALYDAANEALLAAYERRGRLTSSVSAAGVLAPRSISWLWDAAAAKHAQPDVYVAAPCSVVSQMQIACRHGLGLGAGLLRHLTLAPQLLRCWRALRGQATPALSCPCCTPQIVWQQRGSMSHRW